MIALPPMNLVQRLRDAGHVAGPLIVVLVIGACGVTASDGPLETTGRSSGPASPGVGTPSPIRSPDPSASTGPRGAAGLLVLVEAASAGHLYRVGPSGSLDPLADLPAARGLSVGGRRLLVNGLNGQLLIGDVATPTTLRPLAGTDGLRDPTLAGSLSPDGRRVAFASPDTPDAAAFELAVIESTDSSLQRLTVRSAPNGVPFWVGQDRVAVRTVLAHEARGLALANAGRLADGVVQGPSPAGEVVVAVEGGVVIGLRDVTGEIVEMRLADWLAAGDVRGISTGISAPNPLSHPTSLAITPTGDRLAIVWADDAGPNATIAVYERASAWRETGRLPVPRGADLAFVAWAP